MYSTETLTWHSGVHYLDSWNNKIGRLTTHARILECITCLTLTRHSCLYLESIAGKHWPDQTLLNILLIEVLSLLSLHTTLDTVRFFLRLLPTLYCFSYNHIKQRCRVHMHCITVLGSVYNTSKSVIVAVETKQI